MKSFSTLILSTMALGAVAQFAIPGNLPTLNAGDSIIISFDTRIDPNTTVCEVSCQAEVVIGMATILSDDPDTGNPNDPTVTLLADAEAPMAMCNNISVNLSAAGSYNFPPADSAAIVNGTTDNCGSFTATFNPASLSCANVGPNIITVTYTDDSGNSSSCTATVTVSDITPPLASCQDVTVNLNAAGTGSTTSAAVNNGSSDACGIQSMMLSQTSFTCANIGSNPVVLTVTDVNGNSSTCTANVQVVDNIAPTITCPGNQTGNANATCQVALPDYTGSVTASDNCNFSVMQSPTAGTILSGHGTVQVVTMTATDVAGNSASCTFTFTVQDITPPVAACQDITIQLDGNTGMASVSAGDINNGSTDNCGITGLSLSQTAFTCDDFGTTIVTLTATDVAGNTATCTATVTVEDPANFCCDLPVAICQDVTVFLDAMGSVAITPATVNNGSTADCGLAGLGVSPALFSCADVGGNVVTLTVTDNNNNSSTCTSVVTVLDTIAPSIVCPESITTECGPEELPAPDTQSVQAGDNCGVASVVWDGDMTSGMCPRIVTRTYLVTDVNGNTATCTQTITIEDTTPPAISCPEDALSCEDRNCITFDEYTVSPLGSPVVVSSIIEDGVTVDIRAYRKGGIQVNAALLNSDQPVTEPDLGTPNTLYGGPGTSDMDPDGFNTTNNQSLGNLLIIQNPAVNYPDDHILGDSLVFTFSEPVYLSGITTVDFEEEQVTSGARATMYGAGGTLLGIVPLNPALGGDNSMQVLYLNTYGVTRLVVYFGQIVPSSGAIGNLCFTRIPQAVVTDVCSTPMVIATQSAEVDECTTQITQTYFAADACGNTSSATCIIDLTGDYEQPDIMCPGDLVIGCADVLPAPDGSQVGVTDNCSEAGDITVEWVEDITEGNDCDAVTRRVYRATDACGNVAYCVQYITREEMIPLQLSARVMLGGSMTPASPQMYAMLNDMLPEDQPYSGPPFNYTGGENVEAFPENIVDWVFLLLRDPLTMETISQRCALVTSEGDIVDLDGVSPVNFVATPDQYYVVICHRNHLDVMSDLPVNFGSGSGNIDFTLGNAGMLEVNPGEWAMIKGDVNVDGLVNNTDMVQLSPFAAIGYSNEYIGFDVNMDGLVNNTDLVILAGFAAIGYSQGF